ncbi:MAG: glycosyltransferase [Candidatus Micrarchaeota archaeon]|nr:glycosyltransferase [Candidatus Micrarchaeota archaeon]MDE1864439.1 glycosyltransferase [Candidatus Micrarchaeota archaeon]
MRYNDTTIVLPTYNEEKNIGELVSSLVSALPKIRILVVDDGSKDRTAQIVRKIVVRNHGVSYLNRSAQHRPRGLTHSIVDGIMMSKTKNVIVMDADFQHPIDKIPEIKRKLDEGNQLVVAVRVDVPGWELHRKIISRSLIYLGYGILVVRGRIRSGDIFSGYFGVKRKFFREVYGPNRERFVGEGYKVLFDLLKCLKNGSVKIGEVPYVFNVRKAGESKASLKQGIALFRSFVN